jgi:TonB family protein
MRALVFLLLVSSALTAQQAPETPQTPGSGLTPGGHIPLRNVDVLSDTQGVDLTRYLRLNVHFIQHNWWKLTSAEAIGDSHGVSDLALEFTVARDGSVSNGKLSQPSSDSVLDQAALEALRRASPFQQLPQDYSGESLALRVRLHYDPNMAAPLQHWSSNAGPGDLEHAGHPSVPKLIYGPEPEFTDQARRKKIQGVVTLRITVSETGEVTDAVVTKGLGYGLDEKAVEGVRRWKFKPALKDGQPISSTVAVEVNFHLY